MPRSRYIVDIEEAYYTVETYRNKRGAYVTRRIPMNSDHEPIRKQRKSKLELVSVHDVMPMESHDNIMAPRPAQLKVLRTYAKLPDSTITTTLPPTVYFSHTQHTLTIFDAYPKALFHFLILPRISDTAYASDLKDLRTLLRRRASPDAQTRSRAQETFRVLADEAARMRGVVEEEMRARYGFVWGIWTGFHPVPSME